MSAAIERRDSRQKWRGLPARAWAPASALKREGVACMCAHTGVWCAVHTIQYKLHGGAHRLVQYAAAAEAAEAQAAAAATWGFSRSAVLGRMTVHTGIVHTVHFAGRPFWVRQRAGRSSSKQTRPPATCCGGGSHTPATGGYRGVCEWATPSSSSGRSSSNTSSSST